MMNRIRMRLGPATPALPFANRISPAAMGETPLRSRPCRRRRRDAGTGVNPALSDLSDLGEDLAFAQLHRRPAAILLRLSEGRSAECRPACPSA